MFTKTCRSSSIRIEWHVIDVLIGEKEKKNKTHDGKSSARLLSGGVSDFGGAQEAKENNRC